MQQITLHKTRKLIYPIAGLIIIIIVVLIFALFQGKKKPKLEEIPKIPANKDLRIVQPSSFQDDLSKLLTILPYTGPDFSIKYFKPTNIVNVYISAKTPPEFKEKKKKAEEFIKSKGVQDICNLNVFWVPNIPQDIRKSIAGDLNTTTCPTFKK